VVSTLADSYLHATFHSAGSAAKTASVRKESKYSVLLSDYIFQPIAFTERICSELSKQGGSSVDFVTVPRRVEG